MAYKHFFPFYCESPREGSSTSQLIPIKPSGTMCDSRIRTHSLHLAQWTRLIWLSDYGYVQITRLHCSIYVVGRAICVDQSRRTRRQCHLSPRRQKTRPGQSILSSSQRTMLQSIVQTTKDSFLHGKAHRELRRTVPGEPQTHI